MGNALYYAQISGVQLAKSYPYTFSQGYCRYDITQASAIVKSYYMAGTEDEEFIKKMLYNVGPLAVTINGATLQYYTGGVINVPYEQCPYAPNHGVNLVGYGTTESGLDYWIVRNTWGPSWGEKGNFRLARGRGLCGINKYVISAILN
jgi:C1A family cysteine protease